MILIHVVLIFLRLQQSFSWQNKAKLKPTTCYRLNAFIILGARLQKYVFQVPLERCECCSYQVKDLHLDHTLAAIDIAEFFSVQIYID